MQIFETDDGKFLLTNGAQFMILTLEELDVVRTWVSDKELCAMLASIDEVGV